MSEKKKNRAEEQDVSKLSGDAVASSAEMDAAEVAGPANTELQELVSRLEQAEEKAAENLDGWQRTQADFQNYRKRTERDNELMYVSMKGDIVRKILPILDDLERALQNRPSDSGPWISGIELIHKKLLSILEAEGVKRIEAEGQPFDPNFHEALSHEPAEGIESGHVIAVSQNGYVLGERVIRPALVRVAQ